MCVTIVKMQYLNVSSQVWLPPHCWSCCCCRGKCCQGNPANPELWMKVFLFAEEGFSYHGGDWVLTKPLWRNTHNRLQWLWIRLPQCLTLKTVWTIANLVFLQCVFKLPQWLASKIAANVHRIQATSHSPPVWNSIHKAKLLAPTGALVVMMV